MSEIQTPSMLELKRTQGEAHRITCPYCQAGAAVVVVERRGEQVSVDLAEPRRCDLCRRFFKLKPRLQLVGVPLEGEG